MKLALEYDVEGTVRIGPGFSVLNQLLEYVFNPDEEGRLKSIRVAVPIHDVSKVVSKIGPGNSHAKAEVTFDVPAEAHGQLMREFQELEAILALNADGAFRRINWQKPRQELIPENEDEARQIAVTSFQVEEEFPVPKFQYDPLVLAKMIETKNRYADLTVVCSFWREGMNSYNDFMFINSFNSFYLVIEALYGGGKTRNRDILEQYKGSQELLGNARHRIADLEKERKHASNIDELLGEKMPVTPEGLLDTMIKLRGRTHHYSIKGGKLYATPLDHRAFQSIAWIALGMATEAILLQTVINRSQTVKGQDR